MRALVGSKAIAKPPFITRQQRKETPDHDTVERLKAGAFGLVVPFRTPFVVGMPKATPDTYHEAPYCVWEDGQMYLKCPLMRYDVAHERVRYKPMTLLYKPLNTVRLNIDRKQIIRTVQSARLDPLHTLTEADAVACGFKAEAPHTARSLFRHAWDKRTQRNKLKDWEENPLVYIVRLFME